MKQFLKTLETQRWDDHRYYHHSRINQTLHLISAISFLVAYAYLFIDPVVSALIAWLVSMTTRQLGHFVFEPKGYDEVNRREQSGIQLAAQNCVVECVCIDSCAGLLDTCCADLGGS